MILDVRCRRLFTPTLQIFWTQGLEWTKNFMFFSENTGNPLWALRIQSREEYCRVTFSSEGQLRALLNSLSAQYIIFQEYTVARAMLKKRYFRSIQTKNLHIANRN